MKVNDLNIVLGNKFHYRDVFIEQDIFPATSKCNDEKLVSNDEYGIFQFFSFNNYIIPHQGFKVHISCTIENFQTILNKTFSYCSINNIAFKFIRNKKILSMILSNRVDRELGGKFITIYPENLSHFKKILEELKGILEGDEGTYILTDKRYQNSSVLYYRYGVMDPGKYGEFMLKPNGEVSKDARRPYFILPEFVNLPFPEADSEKPKYINNIYKINEALTFKNSGGTYKGHYNESSIIIKEARKNFGEIESNSYQMTKQNEAHILEKLDNLEWFPKLIDYFFEFENFYVVEEYIGGETFKEAKMRLCNIDSNNNSIDSYKEIADIFINILSAVEAIHENKVFIGDISEENIKLKNNKPFFIDVEQSIILTNNKSKKEELLRTMGFYNKEIFELDLFRQDYHQIGYLFMSMFCKANMLLNIDITGVLSMNQLEKLTAHNSIPIVFIKTIKQLINGENINTSELISDLKTLNDKNELENIMFDYVDINKSLKYQKNILEKSVRSTFENSIKFPTNFPSKSDKGILFGSLGVEVTLKEKINWSEQDIISCIEKEDYISLLEYIVLKQDYQFVELLLNNIMKTLNNPYRNVDNEYSLSSGITGIGYLLNQLPLKNDYRLKKIYMKLTSKIHQLVIAKCIEDMKNLERNEVDLSLLNGLLGNVYYLISCTVENKNVKLISLIKSILDIIIKNYLTEISGITHLYLYSQGNLASAYVQNGTSGLILTLLEYSNNVDKHYDELISTLGSSLTIDYTQAGGFLYGLSGIGFVHIKLYEKFKATHYLTKALNIYRRLDVYLFEYENKIQTYGPSFLSMGIDFGHGLTGIYYFVFKLEETLNKNKVTTDME